MHNCCPACRHELGNIRCLALEKVAESLELPCRYQILGCHDIFPYYSKLKHEKNCKYRPYNCPYAGADCSVAGDIPFLVMHLKNDHKVDMHDGCSFSHRYVKSNPQEVGNATWMLTVRALLSQHPPPPKEKKTYTHIKENCTSVLYEVKAGENSFPPYEEKSIWLLQHGIQENKYGPHNYP